MDTRFQKVTLSYFQIQSCTPDSSDNKFGSRKLRKGSKNQRKGIIDGDGYLKTKVKANLWAHCIKAGIDR